MNYIGIRGRIILLVIISLSLSILIAAIMFRKLIYNNVINHKIITTDIITSSILHDIKYNLERRNFDMAARADTLVSIINYRNIFSYTAYTEKSGIS